MADASGVLRPQIHILDHLGSVRVIVDKSGNVVERDSYYPYGERWNDGSIVQADNRYRYGSVCHTLTTEPVCTTRPPAVG